MKIYTYGTTKSRDLKYVDGVWAFMNTSVKRVKKSKLQQAIDDHKVEGWTLKSEGDNTAVMEKLGGWGSGFSHLIIFLLFFWCTFGALNLAWAAYVHYFRDKQELQIKADLEE